MYKKFSIALICILFLYSLLGIGVANLNLFSIPILQFTALTICAIFFAKFKDDIEKTFSYNFWFILLLFILYIIAIFFYSLSKNYPLIRIIQDMEIFYDILFIFGGIGVIKILNKNFVIKSLEILFLVMSIWYIVIVLTGQEIIQFISPKVGGVFRSVPLFGAYPSYTFFLLGVPFFLFVTTPRKTNTLKAFIIGIIALLAQKRFILIEGLLIAFFYLRGSLSKVLFYSSLLLPILIFVLFTFENLEIRTSKGDLFSIDLITETWKSTFIQNEESGGVSWRYNLYQDSLNKINNINNFLFGIGFGVNLTNLTDTSTGLIIRTPHVYLLTVFLRTGLIGLIFTTYFFYTFFVQGYYIYKHQTKTVDKNFNYFLLFSFLVFFIEAQTNPMLEYAHVAFPRYFLLGLLLGQKN